MKTFLEKISILFVICAVISFAGALISLITLSKNLPYWCVATIIFAGMGRMGYYWLKNKMP